MPCDTKSYFPPAFAYLSTMHLGKSEKTKKNGKRTKKKKNRTKTEKEKKNQNMD
jgi:hypothetical protein